MSAEQSKELRPMWLLAWLPERMALRLSRAAGPLATLLASLGAFGFFALQGILLARMLGPELRGAFAAAVLFPQTLLYLGLLGAPELFAGYAARSDQAVGDAPLRRSAAWYGLFAGLFSLAMCVALDAAFITAEFRWVLPLALVCALSLPLQQIRLAVQAVDHGQRQFTRYNQGRLLSAAAFPVLMLIGWPLGGNNLTVICWIFLASQGLALLLAQRGMRQPWRGPLAVPVTTAMKEARPLIGAWLASELLERIDMCLMMILVSNQAILGFYASALPIAALLIIVPNAASLYAFNRGARSDEIPTFQATWKVLLVGLIIQCLCAAILAVLLPILVPLFYGDRFDETIRFAWWLLPAGMFRGLLQAIDGYLRARGKATFSVVIRLLGTAILITVATRAGGLVQSWNWHPAYAIPLGLSVALGFSFIALSAIMLWDVHQHHRSQGINQ